MPSRPDRTENRVSSADRVYFLVFNAHGQSGVLRSVITLANNLVERRQVEVLSLVRRGESPHYDIDPRVKLTHLGTNVVEDESRRELPPKIQRTLGRALESLDPGVLVTTRPVLHVAAARLAPPHLVKVGQDHLNFQTRMRRGHAVEAIDEALQGLDAFTVLTHADAVDYRERFPAAHARVEVIRNAAPWPVAPATGSHDKVVVAAGRLVKQKAFHRLIKAYTPVAVGRPDWRLHIYGEGGQRERLEKLIRRRGIGGQVELMGHSDEFESRLAEASIYAMTSRYEGFPMVLVEAMTKGVPAISYDCPRGPAEIIRDGDNGRLIPNGDEAAFTGALLAMIDDDAERRRMSAAATEQAAEYRIETISRRWETLFDQLLEARRG